MKRLYIVVEGQTEQEFIKSTLSPYLNGKGIFSVTPILIKTSKHGRGGHVNATHLTNKYVTKINDNYMRLFLNTNYHEFYVN